MDTFKERTVQTEPVSSNLLCISLSLLWAMYLNNNSSETAISHAQHVASDIKLQNKADHFQPPVDSSVFSSSSASNCIIFKVICHIPLCCPSYPADLRYNILIKLKFPQGSIKYTFICLKVR